jgi:hypothetical protein
MSSLFCVQHTYLYNGYAAETDNVYFAVFQYTLNVQLGLCVNNICYANNKT